MPANAKSIRRDPPLYLPFPVETGKSHGFLHSIADSMRESSGIPRHDAPKASVQLPEGEAPEPGTVEKIKASISGVAGASQVLGWGAQGSKKGKSDVEVTAPSVEVTAPSVEVGGADVSVSAPSVDASAAVPSVEGDASVPAVEGGLTLPSGSVDGGGEFLLSLLCVLMCLMEMSFFKSVVLVLFTRRGCGFIEVLQKCQMSARGWMCVRLFFCSNEALSFFSPFLAPLSLSCFPRLRSRPAVDRLPRITRGRNSLHGTCFPWLLCVVR